MPCMLLTCVPLKMDDVGRRVSQAKWRTKYKGRYYSHGDRRYRIAPGTKRGDSYCARSYGILKKYGKTPKNVLSRRKWKCKGKKSMKACIEPAQFVEKDNYEHTFCSAECQREYYTRVNKDHGSL